MDLSTIEGLTPELQEQITALHDSEVAGLKANADKLLDEKKTAAQKATEMEEAAEKARLAATEAEKQRLANEGKFDELKALHEKEMAEATAKANQLAEDRQSALDQIHKGDALNSALSLIHDDFKGISTPMLSNMIDLSYNEQGQPVTKYKFNGETVATDTDGFKSWALTQDSFKRIMNGVDSSGAGSTNTGKGGKTLTLTERAILANQQKI